MINLECAVEQARPFIEIKDVLQLRRCANFPDTILEDRNTDSFSNCVGEYDYRLFLPWSRWRNRDNEFDLGQIGRSEGSYDLSNFGDHGLVAAKLESVQKLAEFGTFASELGMSIFIVAKQLATRRMYVERESNAPAAG